MYLLLLLAFISAVSAATPNVTLGNTTLVGREFSQFKHDFFGGIPYAKPPVGELRLQPPVKAELNGTTFDASNYTASCLQPRLNMTEMSEDCLTINVYRPTGVSEGANLPVMFWTYGGGFLVGTATTWNASAILAQSIARGTPIVYVSFNYRLGPLGFPQGGEAGRKGALNLALRDQVLALEWVQENIHAFGGDKSKVTIFGESAGSIMIGIQFLNPDFSKLVRAAMFESGSAATPFEHTPEFREDDWTNFVAGVPGCTSVANTNNTFDCLKTANSTSLLSGIQTAIDKSDELFAFSPTLDGPGGFLPERPSKLWEKGQFARLPFIAGNVLDEGTVFVPASSTYDEQSLRQVLRANFSSPDVSVATLDGAIDRIVQLYPDEPALGSPFNTGNETFGLPQGYKRWAAITGDMSFHSQRRLWQQTVSKTGVKTYGYLFTQPQAGSGAIGVSHGSDVLYVYGGVTDPADVSLSRTIIDYWVSFATSLDPNDGKGLPRPMWNSYTPNSQVLLELNNASTKLIPDNFRKEQMDFINQNPTTFLHRRS
ncbi:hypothetical protein V5O48_003165 [Marasmius crinis-equi]|uniref:Carboxylic ester hydrolase n=1 Tax=Marasmius crinis-equi TaxID=585013 RepID=A0ABR3FTN4_9AGAR